VKLGTLHLNVRKVHRSAPIILMLFVICESYAPTERRKRTRQTSHCSQKAGDFSMQVLRISQPPSGLHSTI
jgi:hypothetical protein